MKKIFLIGLMVLVPSIASADVFGSQVILKRSSCTAITQLGLGCYDTDDFTLCFGNGSSCAAIGGGGNSFETINVPAGTDPVADSATDTLNITETGALVITGTAATETIDITFAANGLTSTEIDGSTLESEIEAVADLQDFQGAVTDGQVPNTITIDSASSTEGTDFGTLTDTKVCTYDLTNTEIDCASDPGAEINNLETITTGIASTEIPIGTAADTVVYAALSGQATMTNGGVVTVNDLTCTNCLTNTEVASADLATNVADTDFGDVTVASGAWAVEDDSHAHTSSSISGLDISADTNLTAGDNLTITDDDIDLDATVTIGTSILSPIFSSTTADPADAGIVRFANGEGISWEASPAGTDVTMTLDTSEILQIANGTLDGGDLTSATVTATQLGTDSVSADELNATGVEAELESTLDIGGEVTSTGMASTVIADSITVTGWVMGASTATTPSADDNDTSLATTAFVQTELTGGFVLVENASIGFDPAGSADGKYSGQTVTATSGYTQAFGDLVYLDPTDSRWEAVDANAAAAADGDARGVIGMVVVTGTDGNACTILLQGIIRADANFPALTINAPVYAAEAAGDIVVAQPTTADVVIRVVGFALTADEIYFNASSDYITHT